MSDSLSMAGAVIGGSGVASRALEASSIISTSLMRKLYRTSSARPSAVSP